MNLPKGLQLDLVGRYTDVLPAVLTIPSIPSYFTFDARLAWQFKSLEISLVGQNLLKSQHNEVSLSKIPRSLYGKVTWRF